MEYRQAVADGVDVIALLEADVKRHEEVWPPIRRFDEAMTPRIGANRVTNLVGVANG